jgi:hypothetical protein
MPLLVPGSGAFSGVTNCTCAAGSKLMSAWLLTGICALPISAALAAAVTGVALAHPASSAGNAAGVAGQGAGAASWAKAGGAIEASARTSRDFMRFTSIMSLRLPGYTARAAGSPMRLSRVIIASIRVDAAPRPVSLDDIKGVRNA